MKMKTEMRLKQNIRTGLSGLLIALSGWSCFSCSEDLPDGGKDLEGKPEAAVTVKVMSAEMASAATRALGTFETTPASNELISSCVVAFVKADGTVAEVKELTEETPAEETEEFTVILKQGSYSVYAFANIEKSSLSGLKLTKGEKIGNVNVATFAVNAEGLTETSKIPMSGFLTGVTVAENGGVSIGGVNKSAVSIPVVRMVGKVEFQFTNNSAANVTVTEIGFKPCAEGNVKLLPTWAEGSATTLAVPDMTGVTVGKEVKKTLADFIVKTDGAEKKRSYTFYVREVVSNHETGGFPFSIKFNDGKEMTALLYDLTTINRNDWIRVPITLTDRKLKLDVEFYPPIGGYPPVSWVDKDDEYYVTFSTGGWFSIEATVVNKGSGEAVAKKNVELKIADGGISNTGFFRQQPVVESSGEITGEIKTGLETDSRSIVTLEVSVTEKNASGTVITKEKFLRKIHFIYK